MCLEACISLLLSVPQGLEKAVLINMGGHTAPVQQLLDPPELFEQRELDLIYLYIVLLGADGRVHPRCRANGIPRRAERPAKIIAKTTKKGMASCKNMSCSLRSPCRSILPQGLGS